MSDVLDILEELADGSHPDYRKYMEGVADFYERFGYLSPKQLKPVRKSAEVQGRLQEFNRIWKNEMIEPATSADAASRPLIEPMPLGPIDENADLAVAVIDALIAERHRSIDEAKAGIELLTGLRKIHEH
jgi:hypothetical protein